MTESSEKIANEALMAMGDEIERLRAELASAKALLRESVREAFDSCYVLHPDGVDLLRRIRAALGDEP